VGQRGEEAVEGRRSFCGVCFWWLSVGLSVSLPRVEGRAWITPFGGLFSSVNGVRLSCSGLSPHLRRQDQAGMTGRTGGASGFVSFPPSLFPYTTTISLPTEPMGIARLPPRLVLRAPRLFSENLHVCSLIKTCFLRLRQRQFPRSATETSGWFSGWHPFFRERKDICVVLVLFR
jgi:hypothetical protein